MITKVKIQGYKSIKEQIIELRPINILLGSNGVGKSNFISSFGFIRDVYNQDLQYHVMKKGGVDSLLHYGSATTKTCEIGLTFEDTNHISFTFEFIQNSLMIKKTQSFFKGHGNIYPQTIEKFARESNISNNFEGQAYYINQWMNDFEVYHFHDTGDTSPIKKMSKVRDVKKLRKDGSNIAAFLYHLKKRHPKNFNIIENQIKSIAPFFKRFDLSPHADNPETIELTWVDKNHPDTYFNAYNLSDGTLRFICLTTLLMQPDPPKTIIIDEPELGLHPYAIDMLASTIKKASINSQIIISTQSVNLVDNFEGDDIIITDKQDDSSKFIRLDKEKYADWLKTYTISELWEKNIIGGQPYNQNNIIEDQPDNQEKK